MTNIRITYDPIDVLERFDVRVVPGPKDWKVYFSDTQFLTFDPDNVDVDDLERRVEFWHDLLKVRNFSHKILKNTAYGQFTAR